MLVALQSHRTHTTISGFLVRRERERLNLVQLVLAEKSYCSTSVLSSLENGVFDPHADSLSRVCICLAIEPSELMAQSALLKKTHKATWGKAL